MTQGDPDLLTIFNIVMEAVVRAVLLEIYWSKELHNGLGCPEGEHKIFLCADNGHISSCKPI